MPAPDGGRHGSKPRVLHAAGFLDPPPGVVRQMRWEARAARDLGIAWDVRIFVPSRHEDDLLFVADDGVEADATPSGFSTRARRWLGVRRRYHDWLERVAGNYDALLLRYSVHDPFLYRFVRRATRPVFLVHHSLEIPELASGGPIGRLRAGAEHLLGARILGRAAGIVAMTEEIAQYECQRSRHTALPVFAYPNGVAYERPPAADRRQEPPRLLFVASTFVNWHGLDRLLDSAAGCGEDFIVDIVGTVPEDLAAQAGADARFVLHGRLDQDRIAELAENAWAGLSSLALDRKGMRQACTLKVREYLMLGLPVYAGYEEVFRTEFQFYRNGPCDMAAILAYARAMRETDRKTVSEAAHPHVEKSRLLADLYSRLSDSLDGDRSCAGS